MNDVYTKEFILPDVPHCLGTLGTTVWEYTEKPAGKKVVVSELTISDGQNAVNLHFNDSAEAVCALNTIIGRLRRMRADILDRAETEAPEEA